MSLAILPLLVESSIRSVIVAAMMATILLILRIRTSSVRHAADGRGSRVRTRRFRGCLANRKAPSTLSTTGIDSGASDRQAFQALLADRSGHRLCRRRDGALHSSVARLAGCLATRPG